ncbi:MAG TPA: hypothetical protein VGW12_10060 [Pyrinomonadaceae bacterium]|nr:hypothetical protein [Pyrinomonadaceae bacterium]
MLNLQKRSAARTAAFATRLVSLVVASLFVHVALVVAGVQNAARAVSSANKEVLSVSEARRRPLGTVVIVDGSVTVPSGAFKSGTSDEGFALQDSTGGLYVRTARNLALRIGREVRVTGQLADSNGQLILVPAGAQGVTARAQGAKVAGESVQTGGVNEATEGRLVRVTGRITKPVGNDLPYGYRVFIDDGSGEVQAFVYVSTGIDVRRLRPGQRIDVTGFSGQYNDHYEVLPRFQSDIRRLR